MFSLSFMATVASPMFLKKVSRGEGYPVVSATTQLDATKSYTQGLLSVKRLQLQCTVTVMALYIQQNVVL